MTSSSVSGAGLRRMPSRSPTVVATRPPNHLSPSSRAAASGLLETIAQRTPRDFSRSSSAMTPGYGAVLTEEWAR